MITELVINNFNSIDFSFASLFILAVNNFVFIKIVKANLKEKSSLNKRTVFKDKKPKFLILNIIP